jgi:hypothetical protein
LKNNYILIDYENVQPRNLGSLRAHPVKVLVFVGATQAKVPLGLASSLQALGSDAEYVQIGGNGSNALDFHIAFYIGQLAERDPKACFHIISKDTGFDPLIKHLKARGILAQRHKALCEIPFLRISEVSSWEDKIAAIVKDLSKRGHARPLKVKALMNTINALFMKKLEESELMHLIDELCERRYLVLDNERVNYAPPISQSS